MLGTSLRTRLSLCALFTCSASQVAFAGTPPAPITVGAAPQCGASSIQLAVDIASQVPGYNRIWITRDTPGGAHNPTAAIDIGDDSLELVGGYDHCLDDTGEGTTIISGAGGAQDPVFRVRGGGNVRFAGLTLTGGDADDLEGGAIDYVGYGILVLDRSIVENNASVAEDGQGGGIRFRSLGGAAELTLRETVVRNNQSDEGAGIYVESEHADRPATLVIGDGTYIEANTASYFGGGIHASRGAHVGMSGARVRVRGNVATFGSGGGLYLLGATAEIGAASPVGTPLFEDNRAAVGGAIALTQPFAEPGAKLTLYSVTPGRASLLARNRASSEGGALASHGANIVCLKNVSMTENLAPIGAAISQVGYLVGNVESRGTFAWNQDCDLPPEASIACAMTEGCNRIEGHALANDQSVIRVAAPATLNWNGVHAIGNRAGQLLRVEGRIPTLAWQDSAIANNATAQAPLAAHAPQLDGTVDLAHLTIVDNAIADLNPVIGLGITHLSMTDSIVDQPTRVLGGATAMTFNRVMANTSDAGLPPGAFAAVPTYASVFRSRYLQALNSRGIDATICGPDTLDGNGNPRNVDIPGVSNGPGTCDLGAFETPASLSNLMFADGFE